MGWDTVVGGDILGGNRDMRLDYTAGGGGSLFRVRAAGSTFTHDQEVGVQGRSETRWDGMTAFDLTEGGTVDTLVLFHVTNDHTSSILFTVNGTSTYTVDLPSAGSPWIEIVIPFSGFSDPIALQSVNSITMLIPDTGSSIATDLKITEISTRISQPPLPPPATVPTLSEWGMILFTLLMGMSGVVFIRRRKMRG